MIAIRVIKYFFLIQHVFLTSIEYVSSIIAFLLIPLCYGYHAAYIIVIQNQVTSVHEKCLGHLWRIHFCFLLNRNFKIIIN